MGEQQQQEPERAVSEEALEAYPQQGPPEGQQAHHRHPVATRSLCDLRVPKPRDSEGAEISQALRQNEQAADPTHLREEHKGCSTVIGTSRSRRPSPSTRSPGARRASL